MPPTTPGSASSKPIKWDLVSAGVLMFKDVPECDIVQHAHYLKLKFGDKLRLFFHPCRERKDRKKRCCLQVEYEHYNQREGLQFQRAFVSSFESKFGKERMHYDMSYKSIEIEA